MTTTDVTVVTAANPPLWPLMGSLDARCIQAQLTCELRIKLQVHDGPEEDRKDV